MLLVVAGRRDAEMSMAMIGEVGSGFTSPNEVTNFMSLIRDGDEGFAGVSEREGRNDLAAGLRGGFSGFAGIARVVSESLISPSSLGVASTEEDG